MKKNKKKALIAALLVAVLVGVSGTVAWLTSTSTLTNEFTVGTFTKPTTDPTDPTETISIDGNLYEPSWDASAEHKLIPANEYAKDPYVGIGPGSEDGVVYLYIDNNFSNKVYFTLNDGWTAVEANPGSKAGTYTSGLFKYNTVLTAGNADVWTTKPLFDKVVTDETATNTDFTPSGSNDSTIVVKSFLHQAKDGSGTAIADATILAAAKSAFGLN